MQHVAYGDPVAGLFGAIACLIALYASQRRRVSAWIDLGQVECLFQLGADALIAQSLQADPLPRDASRHPASILRACVPTAGQDEWLAVSVETERQWGALARLVGPGLEAAAALASWAANRNAEEAASCLQEVGVPAAPVRPAHALLDDPQLRAAGFWRRLERRFIGSHVVPLAPYRFDDAPPPLRCAAPTLGEHNEEVLTSKASLGAADLERLERLGVIGKRPSRATSE